MFMLQQLQFRNTRRWAVPMLETKHAFIASGIVTEDSWKSNVASIERLHQLIRDSVYGKISENITPEERLRRETKESIDAWQAEFGDLTDPEVQYKLEQVVAGLSQTIVDPTSDGMPTTGMRYKTRK